MRILSEISLYLGKWEIGKEGIKKVKGSLNSNKTKVVKTPQQCSSSA